jgi:hypothetical protein
MFVDPDNMMGMIKTLFLIGEYGPTRVHGGSTGCGPDVLA